MNNLCLGVNIDHVATVRNARGTIYPSPVEAAELAIAAGADSITIHLREDRRHIRDQDVISLKQTLTVPMNLEMAVTEEMLNIALEVHPEFVCLVPEKRFELTTEGGLNVLEHQAVIQAACQQLLQRDIRPALFIDPESDQIDAAVACGAPAIELHTGAYADAYSPAERQKELARIITAARYAQGKKLVVNAGHGLNVDNVMDIAAIDAIEELNIGHAIIARAVMIGLPAAVKEIKQLMQQGRSK